MVPAPQLLKHVEFTAVALPFKERMDALILQCTPPSMALTQSTVPASLARGTGPRDVVVTLRTAANDAVVAARASFTATVLAKRARVALRVANTLQWKGFQHTPKTPYKWTLPAERDLYTTALEIVRFACVSQTSTSKRWMKLMKYSSDHNTDLHTAMDAILAS